MQLDEAATIPMSTQPTFEDSISQAVSDMTIYIHPSKKLIKYDKVQACRRQGT